VKQFNKLQSHSFIDHTYSDSNIADVKAAHMFYDWQIDPAKPLKNMVLVWFCEALSSILNSKTPLDHVLDERDRVLKYLYGIMLHSEDTKEGRKLLKNTAEVYIINQEHYRKRLMLLEEA
jgi:hypothetical protein